MLAPRRISDEHVERVVVRKPEPKPANATHLSTRSVAEASGLSHTTMLRIWHAFGLKLHRSENLTLSTDPQLPETVPGAGGCTSIHQRPRWLSVSTTSRTPRTWTAPGRGCRCAAKSQSARRRTTIAAASPIYFLPCASAAAT